MSTQSICFSRMWISLLVSILLCLGLALSVKPDSASAATSIYTMTAFTNNSESNMYVYQSYNGTHYGLLKGPAYTPPADLIRDPSIMKHTDGKYYVVYTTNWTGNTIGIASSTDRINWSFVRNITLTLPSGIGHTIQNYSLKQHDSSSLMVLPYRFIRIVTELHRYLHRQG